MEGDFRVREWLVQPQIGTITRGDEIVRLEPKVMEVLVHLVRHTEEVLPKERIIHAVWGDTFVTDEVLTNAISELRRAFGDDARDPHTIQTLPRRGYRLIATVTPSGRDHPEAAFSYPGRLWNQSVLVVLAAVLISAVVLILWWSPFSPPAGPIDSIAVLPFVNASGDEDSEYLCEGIPGTISSALARLPQLRVIPTSALKRYRGQEVAPHTVSSELGVRAVLTGSVVRRGDTLIVRADLMDGQEGSLIWGQRYSRESSDIFSLETDIARQVAEGLRLQLSDEEDERLAETGTKNPEAYRASLKGRYHNVRSEFGEAVSWLEQAVALDPDYQEAYVGLGWNYFVNAAFKTSQADYSKAKAAWEKVIEIDDSSTLAHWCKAWILFSFEKDWKRAEREFTRAKEVDPSFERATGLWFYEAFVDWMGRREERLALIERALKRVDPLSPGQQIMPGYAFLWNREYDRAIEQAKNALALKPELVVDKMDAYRVLAGSYDRKGRSKEAFAATLEAARLAGRSDEEMAAMEKAFEAEGMQGVSRWHLDRRLKEGNTRLINLAALYARLGDKDKAFEWLEKAWEQPLWGYENAPSSWTWDSLRDDPRFEHLLRRLNLPEDAIARHLAAADGTP